MPSFVYFEMIKSCMVAKSVDYVYWTNSRFIWPLHSRAPTPALPLTFSLISSWLLTSKFWDIISHFWVPRGGLWVGNFLTADCSGQWELLKNTFEVGIISWPHFKEALEKAQTLGAVSLHLIEHISCGGGTALVFTPAPHRQVCIFKKPISLTWPYNSHWSQHFLLASSLLARTANTATSPANGLFWGHPEMLSTSYKGNFKMTETIRSSFHFLPPICFGVIIAVACVCVWCACLPQSNYFQHSNPRQPLIYFVILCVFNIDSLTPKWAKRSPRRVAVDSCLNNVYFVD